MDIKKVYENGSLTKYFVKGVTPAFMNAIRRTVLTEVPCLAIDEVTLYNNDSVLFDELLSNRLGLLPIKTDKSYKKGDTVKLVLEKTGPGIVTSKDIKCTDPKIEIADKKIYIAKLGKDQSIKLEMTAVMNTGKEHARFQPAIISYNEVPSIVNTGKISNIKELMHELPKGSVEEKAGKLFLVDPYYTKIQNQPADILGKYGIDLEYAKDEFVLTVESTGQLTDVEVIKGALDTLNAKLEELGKELEKI